jgi:hypothetical protein
MRRILLIAVLAAGLAACETVSEATGGSSLEGQDLGAAVGIYGPWDDYVILEGKPTYIWRRRYEADGQAYYCEMRVEMGFRRTIRGSRMQGFPDACRLFSTQYKTKLN